MKKDFILHAAAAIAISEFLAWTGTFDSGAFYPTISPLEGIGLRADLSDLFAVGEDDDGLILVSHHHEAPWLEGLPLECAFVGFDDSLILATKALQVLDTPFERVCLSIALIGDALRAKLQQEQLLGFGLYRSDLGSVQRVNKIIPLYNPQTYRELQLNHYPVCNRVC